MARFSVFPWLSGSLAAIAAATAFGLLIAGGGGHFSSGPARYNLIVLTVESWRADAVSESLTPRLLALLDEHDGIRFRNHRSVSAWTVPNIVALLSGTHPVRQGVLTRGQSLAGSTWNGFSDRNGLDFPMSSFQPFALIESYDRLGLVREPGGTFPLALAGLARTKSPRGLWYHYLDTHLPHRPTRPDGTQPPPDDPDFDTALGLPAPSDAAERSRRRAVATQPTVPVEQVRFPPSDRRWVDAFYNSEVRAFDRWFEGIFDIYVRTGLVRNTVLIVTADHGEELAEQGRVGHASTTREAVLSDSVLNVPMMIWSPDPRHRTALRAWAESGAVTDHVDLGGTLPVLVGGAFSDPGLAVASFGNPPPRDLLPRDLTGAVLPGARVAFTSAAGFAEPDPDRTDYVLLSREDAVGRNVIRLEWEDLADGGGAVGPPFRAAATAIVLPQQSGPTGIERPGGGGIRWVWPRASGDIAYSDIRDRSRIEWSGSTERRYILEYSAGAGAMQMTGEIEVDGNGYTFGRIDRDYWQSFVVPYGTVRFRVRDDRADMVSEWLTVRLK